VPLPVLAGGDAASPAAKRSRTGIIAGLLAVVIVAAIGVVAFMPKQGAVPAGTPDAATSATGSPAAQPATPMSAPAPTATSAEAAAATGSAAPPSAGAAGATTSTTPPVAGDATAQQPVPAMPPVPEATGTGSIRLAVKPWAMVRVDGVEKAVTPPLKLLTLPVGKHTIELVNSAFPPYIIEIDVEKDKRITVSYEFK
jgi:non-specific serine/threonine protein kinase